jgi:hypothetical protein
VAVTNRPDVAGTPGTPGVARPTAARTDASVASQALVAGALLVTFAAMAVRTGSPTWFAAPAAALLVGIVVGLQVDLRRWFAAVPGVLAAMITLVTLSIVWALVLDVTSSMASYAIVPLAALATFGADWRWVERLRPTTVASGALLVLLLYDELDATLPLTVVWFAVATAALWSLRRDAAHTVPTPAPLAGGTLPVREPGAARTAAAVAGSWLVAGLVVALLGLIPLAFDSPDPEGRFDADGRLLEPGSGGLDDNDPGDGRGYGDIGPGDPGDEGIQDGTEDRDVDGDGIPDRDIDGDGTPDVDIDGDGIPDVDRDGDGVPDEDVFPDPGDRPSDGSNGSPTPSGEGRLVEDTDAGAGTGSAVGSAARVLGIALLVLAVAVLVALAARALARAQARRRALAARPWAVRLAERLDREGARRGRARRRDEPVTGYAAALAAGVLPDDRLPDVGAALSAALFGPGPAPEATGEWAVRVVDEAAAAHPVPTWWDGVRARARRTPRD